MENLESIQEEEQREVMITTIHKEETRTRNGVLITTKEVRLSWEESQKHYLAMCEIEEKAWGSNLFCKISNGLKKKIEAKVHNEKSIYLTTHNLDFKLGGFYKKEMVSHD